MSFRLRGRELIDEQLAVEMVDLVAEDAGQQVLGVDLDRLSLEVEAATVDLLGPGDFFEDLRERTGSLPRRMTSPSCVTISGLTRTIRSSFVLADREVDR